MLDFINRVLCWLNGYHIEPRCAEEYFICRFCKQDTFYTRCTGWPHPAEEDKS